MKKGIDYIGRRYPVLALFGDDVIGWFTLEEAEKLPLSIVTKYDISLLRKKQNLSSK